MKQKGTILYILVGIVVITSIIFFLRKYKMRQEHHKNVSNNGSDISKNIPCPWNPDEWCTSGNCPQWATQYLKNPCICDDYGQSCMNCGDQGCAQCFNQPGGGCIYTYG